MRGQNEWQDHKQAFQHHPVSNQLDQDILLPKYILSLNQQVQYKSQESEQKLFSYRYPHKTQGVKRITQT